jgi:hypothetical protein
MGAGSKVCGISEELEITIVTFTTAFLKECSFRMIVGV